MKLIIMAETESIFASLCCKLYTSIKKNIKLNRSQGFILLEILILLTIPLIEQMDGNATFDWGPFDFVLAFLLLLTLGFGIDLIPRLLGISKEKDKTARIAIYIFYLLFLIKRM
ncbi:MAG: hypothetical protein EB023_07605 [Flavobacteriia bacterium]|nr:hypothetical protein [Flavobacteriia bacterium]